MENYAPNSHRSKQAAEEEKKPEAMITGTAHVKKRNAVRRVADIFLAEDISTVCGWVLSDVIVPGFKRLLVSSVDMLLNGKKGSSQNRSSSVSTVSYRDYYDDRDRSSSRKPEYFDYDEITYETRGDAELVLDQMRDILARFRVVRVSDMFDLSRMSSPYTGNRYGWTNLDSARIMPTRDGYVIKMPRALPLD